MTGNLLFLIMVFAAVALAFVVFGAIFAHDGRRISRQLREQRARERRQ